MASDTATAKSNRAVAPPARRLGAALPVSRLGRTIIALNLISVLILVIGALVINERQKGLVNAQIESLLMPGEWIASIIEDTAVQGEPEPYLDADAVRQVMLILASQGVSSNRMRVFDAQGNLLADSYAANDRIETRRLPPLRRPGGTFNLDPRAADPNARPRPAAVARQALERDLKTALQGQVVTGLRPTPSGDRVVSVTLPLMEVRAVTGVLTLEGANLDRVVSEQRWALLPFILMALAVSLISTLVLNHLIARPVRRLAHAADEVTLSRARSISLPDLANRNDELGDLSRALETMTTALSQRMDAIDRFAADVAHEIRNPLTSIRSAVETLELVKDATAQARLTAILKQDVSRLDRLITDISNASRLDAELSRDQPRPLDLAQLLGEVVTFYGDTSRPGQARVLFTPPDNLQPIRVAAREGPLSQVFRNLIDNARSFSPLSNRGAEAEVRVSLHSEEGRAIVQVEDDGPGIPAENIETIFERFYTSRPKGAAFGGNSGLGLSIAREIVNAHGGRIWAENRSDASGQVAGARFVVSLPLRTGA